MKSQNAVNDVLVVLMKEQKDFYIAQNQHWYRIPTTTRTPTNLLDNTLHFIAFYFPKAFGESKYSIRY